LTSNFLGMFAGVASAWRDAPSRAASAVGQLHLSLVNLPFYFTYLSERNVVFDMTLFTIALQTQCPLGPRTDGKCILTADDPIYKHCIRLALLEYITLPEKDAVKEFFDELQLP
jgi:hypothetical protein